jgi:hypothetical protein
MTVRNHAPGPLSQWTALLLCGSLGCGAASPQAVIPNGGHDPSPLARCRIAADRADPLVTEWPASSKARLEALMREQGAIAVAYSGCELRIVDECRVAGSYEWKRTTLSKDTTDIHDDDDLYAKLPLGAASLEGDLKRSGSLEVVTTVSGELDLVGAAPEEVLASPACSAATHIVRAISVGAFELKAQGSAGVKASLGIGSAGAGGAKNGSTSTLREAGDPAKCTDATHEGPSPACRSPIQIFLDPVRRPAPPAAIHEVPVASDAEAPPPLTSGPPTPEPQTLPISPPPGPPAASPASPLPGFVLGGTGVASLGLGTLFLVRASSARSSISSGGLATSDDIESKASQAATATNLGLVLTGAGAALLITAIPFLFRGSHASATAAVAGAR